VAGAKKSVSINTGLENAEFVRYGVMHRNTFINSPVLLDATYCLKKSPNIYFAGRLPELKDMWNQPLQAWLRELMLPWIFWERIGLYFRKVQPLVL